MRDFDNFVRAARLRDVRYHGLSFLSGTINAMLMVRMMMVMMELSMVTFRKISCTSHTSVVTTTAPAGETASKGVGVWVTRVVVFTNPSATISVEGVGVWVTRAGETAIHLGFRDHSQGV